MTATDALARARCCVLTIELLTRGIFFSANVFVRANGHTQRTTRSNLIPFLKKYKRDPISGEPATPKDYTALHFHKNAEGVS